MPEVKDNLLIPQTKQTPPEVDEPDTDEPEENDPENRNPDPREAYWAWENARKEEDKRYLSFTRGHQSITCKTAQAMRDKTYRPHDVIVGTPTNAIVPVRSKNLIVGHEKSLKTTFMMRLAVCIATCETKLSALPIHLPRSVLDLHGGLETLQIIQRFNSAAGVYLLCSDRVQVLRVCQPSGCKPHKVILHQLLRSRPRGPVLLAVLAQCLKHVDLERCYQRTREAGFVCYRLEILELAA